MKEGRLIVGAIMCASQSGSWGKIDVRLEFGMQVERGEGAKVPKDVSYAALGRAKAFKSQSHLIPHMFARLGLRVWSRGAGTAPHTN